MAGGKQAVLGVDIDVSAPLIFINHDESRIFDDLFWSLPFKVLKDGTPVGQVSSILVKLCIVGRKILIDPLLTRIVG